MIHSRELFRNPPGTLYEILVEISSTSFEIPPGVSETLQELFWGFCRNTFRNASKNSFWKPFRHSFRNSISSFLKDSSRCSFQDSSIWGYHFLRFFERIFFSVIDLWLSFICDSLATPRGVHSGNPYFPYYPLSRIPPEVPSRASSQIPLQEGIPRGFPELLEEFQYKFLEEFKKEFLQESRIKFSEESQKKLLEEFQNELSVESRFEGISERILAGISERILGRILKKNPREIL